MIHIITGEYPPTPGGVADYSAQVAEAWALQYDQVPDQVRDRVHVWAPGAIGTRQENGVSVHRVAGSFGGPGLARLDRELSRMPGPRRLLVQWTPHSFGMRSLNVPFALWLWKRARRDRDRIELMIHEPFVAFGEGSRKQDAAAAVHRMMAAILLQAAAKVWISIPAWEQRLRPLAMGRPIDFEWLPVPSNIPRNFPARAALGIRASFVNANRLDPKQPLIGHFGTFREDIANLLEPALAELLGRTSATVLLVGRGSDDFCVRMVSRYPHIANRVIPTGELPASEVAPHLAACDALLQPYPDGISARRGTAMAGLSLGLPVVTNTGHLSEPFWKSDNVVALAASGWPGDLADCMRDLLLDAGRRVELGTRARQMYAERFDLQHTLARLLDVQSPAATLAVEAAA